MQKRKEYGHYDSLCRIDSLDVNPSASRLRACFDLFDSGQKPEIAHKAIRSQGLNGIKFGNIPLCQSRQRILVCNFSLYLLPRKVRVVFI